MRRVALRPAPPADRSREPGYWEWHAPVYGRCCVCGERGRLERHHVVLEQHLRALGRPAWDLRNSMLLGMHCPCHGKHTNAAQRLSLDAVPDEAIRFATDVYGPAAGDYLTRHYR